MNGEPRRRGINSALRNHIAEKQVQPLRGIDHISWPSLQASSCFQTFRVLPLFHIYSFGDVFSIDLFFSPLTADTKFRGFQSYPGFCSGRLRPAADLGTSQRLGDLQGAARRAEGADPLRGPAQDQLPPHDGECGLRRPEGRRD